MIRRLRLPADEDLIREAYRWDVDFPRWYREMDQAFSWGDEDAFVQKGNNPLTALIGIYDLDEMIALVIVETVAPHFHAGHICVRRGADPVKIAAACASLISDLFNLGMTQAIAWVAERNIGVRKLCVRIGLQPDGVAQWRGSYHGKPIKWLRHSINRQQIGIDEAAA